MYRFAVLRIHLVPRKAFRPAKALYGIWWVSVSTSWNYRCKVPCRPINLLRRHAVPPRDRPDFLIVAYQQPGAEGSPSCASGSMLCSQILQPLHPLPWPVLTAIHNTAGVDLLQCQTAADRDRADSRPGNARQFIAIAIAASGKLVDANGHTCTHQPHTGFAVHGPSLPWSSFYPCHFESFAPVKLCSVPSFLL
jgi:hypothetical protein